MTRNGGFKSRPRVVALRAVVSLIRAIPMAVRYTLPEEYEKTVRWKRHRDYVDTCPHLPEWFAVSSWMNPDWWDCTACGRCVKNPKGWLI